MTNFEKIKNMSVDVMVYKIYCKTGLECTFCAYDVRSEECYKNSCVSGIKKWLESEA